MHHPLSTLPNITLLDNPIWHSLTGRHAAVASAHGLARRYPAHIGPLAALQTESPAAWDDLASITRAGSHPEPAALFLTDPPQPPAGWKQLHTTALIQMVCPGPQHQPPAPDPILPLTPADYPEMIALATLTEPGPFRERTADLGGFLGIRIAGRLAAMAGCRLAPIGFTEVSAVCTHPDFRGRGLAALLVHAVALAIRAAGDVPFLTSRAANTPAIRVYQRLGFIERRSFHLAVLEPPR